MQITSLEQLQKLKKGDLVHTTFSDIAGNVTEAHGRIEAVDRASIRIVDEDSGQITEYELWRMLSLVCIKRDISFIREGDILSDLEHVAHALDSRLQRGDRKKRKK